MELKVSMVMMSHLSDVQDHQSNPNNRLKINFVKFLILKFKDTNVYIDPVDEYAEFEAKFPEMAKERKISFSDDENF